MYNNILISKVIQLLKGSVWRDFRPLFWFFHDSNPSRPLINRLKCFRNRFRFRTLPLTNKQAVQQYFFNTIPAFTFYKDRGAKFVGPFFLSYTPSGPLIIMIKQFEIFDFESAHLLYSKSVRRWTYLLQLYVAFSMLSFNGVQCK